MNRLSAREAKTGNNKLSKDAILKRFVLACNEGNSDKASYWIGRYAELTQLNCLFVNYYTGAYKEIEDV